MHILSIVRIVGILVMCFSVTMLAPAFVALLYGDGGGKSFMQAFVISLVAGALLWWWSRQHKEDLRSREAFFNCGAVLDSVGVAWSNSVYAV